jgi:hypothetical protein
MFNYHFKGLLTAERVNEARGGRLRFQVLRIGGSPDSGIHNLAPQRLQLQVLTLVKAYKVFPEKCPKELGWSLSGERPTCSSKGRLDRRAATK